eukprot:gene9999-8873_t
MAASADYQPWIGDKVIRDMQCSQPPGIKSTQWRCQ